MATLNVKNVPDELYEQVRRRARRERRSLSQEVIVLLGRSLVDAPSRSILDLQGLGRDAWAGTTGEQHVKAERDAWE